MGSCGKQCIVCGKEENRCTQCGHQRAEHCASKEPCECLKQHHAFDRQCLRDSHAYSKGMLLRVCGKKDEEVIWDATKGPKVASRKPSTCCWNLLCKQCEQTTSTIEEHVCRRHDREYYKSLDEGSIHPGDIIVFSAFTYRAMPVNTNIFRFLLDPSHKQSQATGRVLRTLHQAFSDAQEHDSESLPVKSCEKRCCSCIMTREMIITLSFHSFARLTSQLLAWAATGWSMVKCRRTTGPSHSSLMTPLLSSLTSDPSYAASTPS